MSRAAGYGLAAALVLGLGYLAYGKLVVDSPGNTRSAERAIQASAVAGRNSIAVLPFLNLSSDPAREYIATGIAETVLHQLASLRDLTVIARTSSFAYKGQDMDVREIGRQLNVRYLLEGSVQSTDDRLRVTVQLIDAATGGHVWSRSFDRPPQDIFAVQDEIALELAESFALSLDAGARGRLSDAPPDLGAYRHYLIGREILREREFEFWKRAAEQFERAIAIDSQYAEAHAELAIVSLLAPYREPQVERARQAIDTALTLKPGLARGYAAQGLLLLGLHPPDAPAAEAVLRKALALAPDMIDARVWLSNALRTQNRYDEAFRLTERTARVDPLASPLNDNLAMMYADRGDFARAERILKRRLELPQPSIITQLTLQSLYHQTGRLVEAYEAAKRQVLDHVERTGRGGWYDLLGVSYAHLGLWEQAAYWIGRHERQTPDDHGAASYLLTRQGRYEEMAHALPAPASGTPESIVEHATLQALAGNFRNAIEMLESSPELDLPLANPSVADAYQALAWAYFQTDAADLAYPMLQKLDGQLQQLQNDGWLHWSGDLFLFAQNAVIAGDGELALDRLRQAIDAGWRDYYAVMNDPRWQPVSDHPRFAQLMEPVKADIDAQRARVERIDAGDDFVVRLDSLLETRR